MTNDRPILYAEDDENDIFLMRRAFGLAGVQNPLCIVDHGQMAIDYLTGTGPYANRTEHPMPALILLDLKMPFVSGIDVLKWIRSTPAISAIPVLVLTSSNQDSDIQRAYTAGANCYLIKPGKPGELLAIVKGIKGFWLEAAA